MSDPDPLAVSPRTARVYEGLWGVIAQYLKVPREGPRLPSHRGEECQVFHPAPGFLAYLKFWFWIALLAIDGLLLIAWVALLVAVWWLALLLVPLLLVLLVAPELIAYVAIHLRFDATWYVLTPRSLHLRRGIWVIHEMTITFANVQNLKVRSGPVQRLFGIADVVVETAGAGSVSGQHTTVTNRGLIEGVANAPEIRDLVMARVRRQRGAGLGDEPTAGAPTAPRWSAEHLAALREVRDAVASLPETPHAEE